MTGLTRKHRCASLLRQESNNFVTITDVSVSSLLLQRHTKILPVTSLLLITVNDRFALIIVTVRVPNSFIANKSFKWQIRKFARFADILQMWHFADSQFADPFFVISRLKTSASPQTANSYIFFLQKWHIMVKFNFVYLKIL